MGVGQSDEGAIEDGVHVGGPPSQSKARSHEDVLRGLKSKVEAMESKFGGLAKLELLVTQLNGSIEKLTTTIEGEYKDRLHEGDLRMQLLESDIKSNEKDITALQTALSTMQRTVSDRLWELAKPVLIAAIAAVMSVMALRDKEQIGIDYDKLAASVAKVVVQEMQKGP